MTTKSSSLYLWAIPWMIPIVFSVNYKKSLTKSYNSSLLINCQTHTTKNTKYKIAFCFDKRKRLLAPWNIFLQFYSCRNQRMHDRDARMYVLMHAHVSAHIMWLFRATTQLGLLILQPLFFWKYPFSTMMWHLVLIFENSYIYRPKFHWT